MPIYLCATVYSKLIRSQLFIEGSTIRSIVKKKTEHSEWLIVSANLVVQFAIGWVHYHFTAVHPYLPELSPPKASTTSWCASDLPYWTGTTDFNIDNNSP